ncbi:MAG: hypothetical protein L3J21_00705 [Devosiaceae bacterium]|nr:hypothetical protein [Devosiaceae bacterium]
MIAEKKYVAILTSSPALASILAMVLDCEEHLVVNNFSRAANLKQHMRIAPIDLIICDYDIANSSAARLAIDLRSTDLRRDFKMIALSDTISAQTRQACKFAAIDEVIIKPMSPIFVRDRVLARLDNGEESKIEHRESFAAENDFSAQKPKNENNNVINLFANKTPSSGAGIHPQ